MLATLISRIRRNHGLEHATIHVLSEKHRNFSAQGNSDHGGFNLNIYGDIAEEDVYNAVEEAYTRMKNGEHQLAVHPNCGTVLLTSATMATLTAIGTFTLALGLEQKRLKEEKASVTSLANALPSAIIAVVGALIVSRPVGVQLQAKYTVEGDLKNLRIATVKKVEPSIITRLFQALLTIGRPSLRAAAYRIETVG